MSMPSSRRPLVAALWFVAAVLALIAAFIPARNGAPNWSVAAAGFFCLVMGIVAWRRKQSPPPSS